MKQRFARQGINKRRLVILLILATGFASAWISGAAAKEVYTWTDENGVTHFSETPSDAAESQTIRVEGTSRTESSDAYGLSGESAESPSGTGEAGAEENLQSAAQQRRERIAQIGQENRKAQEETDQLCSEHRDRLARIEPVRRVYITNEAGESVRMDDDERIGLVEESKEFIAKNCE
jgi:hypothetical protein